MKKMLVFFAALVIVVLCTACTNSNNPITPADQTSGFKNLAVGDVITFGHYEQDNNLENGKELIEWTVMEVQDGKALLLSKFGLDAVSYNTEEKDVTWETCTMRSWLNEDFLNEAFNKEEQKLIVTTEVDNSESLASVDWTASGGNNTSDHVFLLSYGEAKKYFGIKSFDEDDRKNYKAMVVPTLYACAKGVWTTDQEINEEGDRVAQWWLRSPGHTQNRGTIITKFGAIDPKNVDFEHASVRPALWVSIE